MTHKLSLCECGDYPIIRNRTRYFDVKCPTCGDETRMFEAEEDAVCAWNNPDERMGPDIYPRPNFFFKAAQRFAGLKNAR